MDLDALKRKLLLAWFGAFVFLGLMLFGLAGTIDYWQAWAYTAVIFIPAFFVVVYFLKRDPEFLERRMRLKEKEARQGLIIKAASLVFLIAFTIPGLDRRFGWSELPVEMVIAADILVFLGYALIFLVFRENSYAGRTVQVEKGQKVVSSGPYSVVRHPMYLGALVLYLATPVALGSYVALPAFFLLIPVLIFRILNEEEVLRRDLPGYKEYCQETKYRLIPYIW